MLVCLLTLVMAETVRCAEVDEAFFERRIRPVLVERCHTCHAGEKSRGGLRLDTRDRVLQGGETGPALVAGKPAEIGRAHV